MFGIFFLFKHRFLADTGSAAVAAVGGLDAGDRAAISQDSSKGGAVETGCSDVYDVIYKFILYYYPNPLHPAPTAPPCNEYPIRSGNDDAATVGAAEDSGPVALRPIHTWSLDFGGFDVNTFFCRACPRAPHLPPPSVLDVFR